jgi:uncharacterized protein YcgL (UPF0745 family)
MKCFIYRSPKRNNTYVYLRERDAFAVLPQDLSGSLGVLEFVIELELTPERRLATQDVNRVMQNLRDFGFHIQFPPNEQLVMPQYKDL